MKNEVWISGFGFVTKNGFTKQEVWDSLTHKAKAESSPGACELKGPLDLQEKYLGLSPCAEIGINAVELAWKDAFDEEPEIDKDFWGVYCGTAFGGYVQAEGLQCRTLLKDGMAGMLPGIFNNVGYHLTPDIAALHHQLRGPNATFVSGALASGMAILQAYDDIRYGEVQGIIAVGTETIDPLLAQGHSILGTGNTSLLSGGACALVLESSSLSPNTSQRRVAQILSVAVSGNPGKPGSYHSEISRSLENAIGQALSDAGLTADEISVVVSGEGTFPTEADCYEAAYRKTAGTTGWSRRKFCPKTTLGDTLGASPAMSVGVGLLFIENQAFIKNTEVVQKEIRNVLVTASDPCGSSWALVLQSKF